MQIVRLCREFHCLPYSGGLLQQPNGVILRLNAVLDAIFDFNELEKARQDARNNVKARHAH